MKTLEIGNLWYFLYIIIAAALIISGYFVMRKKSEKAKFWFVFALGMLNFVIHFAKLALPEYQGDYPASWRKCSPENICAVSVLIFPFVYLCKNKTLRDYIVFICMVGGGLAIFVPTGAWSYPPFRLETIRFYLTHILLFAQGFYMVAFNIHRPSYKRFWRVPLCLFAVLGVILINEVIIRAEGFAGQTLNEMVTDLSERNSVYLFGLPDGLVDKMKFITALVPDFMKHGIGVYESGIGYWPLVWMFVPLMVYGNILAYLIGATWEFKNMKTDFLAFKAKMKNKKEQNTQS